MGVNGSRFIDLSLSFYFYIVHSYLKFFAAGRCPDYPWRINLQTQSYCNARCLICPYPTIHKKVTQGIMDHELFNKIAAELAAIKQAIIIQFTLQNEPTLDKNLFNLVKHIKQTSINKYCTVTTNGTLLDTFSPREIAQSEIDLLSISLNAYSRETYQRINLGIDYERVINNITTLINNPCTRGKIELALTANQLNKHEVRQTVDYWYRQGIVMRVNTITNRAGTLDNYDMLGLHDTHSYYKTRFVRLWKRITSRTRQKLGCEYPFYQMNILFNGDVIICCHDWNRQLVIGNVTENTLREIWNSQKMQRIRRLILRKRFDRIDSCRECSLIK